MKIVIVTSAFVCLFALFKSDSFDEDWQTPEAAFDRGEFRIAFDLASEKAWNAPATEQNEWLYQLMDQCRKRAWYEGHRISLPTKTEWRDLKSKMRREETIKYLCRRIPLVKGTGGNPGAIVPSSVRSMISPDKNPATIAVAQQDAEQRIDPFTELSAMSLTEKDLLIVYTFFETDWIFQPEFVSKDSPTDCLPAGRYCLCVLVNSVLGQVNLIRETDLCEDQWDDPMKIASLVQQAKATAASNAAK